MTEIELKKYRSGGSGNIFSFSNTTPTKWVIGDDNGQLHLFDENLKVETLEIGESVISSFAINPNGKECVISFDNMVQVRQYPNIEEEINPLLCRSTLPITHLAYDTDGLHVFISSNEPDVSVQSTSNNSTPLKIKTFENGVRTFAISPDNNYICIIDLKGNVLIYLLKYGEGTKQFIACNMELRSIGIVQGKICSDIGNVGYKISWNTDISNPTIFIGTNKGGASMFTRIVSDSNDITWKEDFFIGIDEFNHNNEQVNLIQFSPNGKFLATSDILGGIIIWSVNNGNFNSLQKYNTTHSGPLKDIAWGPNDGDNYLLVSSNTSWANISEMKLDIPNSDEPVVVTSEAVAEKKDTSKSRKRLQKSSDNTNNDDSDNDTDWNAIGEKLDEVSSTQQKQNKAVVDDNDMDEDDDDDDDNNVEEYEDDNYGSNNNLAEDNNIDQEQFQKYIGMVVEDTFSTKGYGNRILQSTFQPSSTKYNQKNAKFLVWNNIGQITFHDDVHSFRYQIQFSNTSSKNRNISETSPVVWIMAALSLEGAVFASDIEDHELAIPPKEPEFAHGSSIYYKSFPGHFNANIDWGITLQNQEAAIAVACGSGWCAVATSKGFLRIFDSTGAQLAVTSLHGDVLCMTGSLSKLAIIYHDAPVGVNNRLCVYIYEINRLSNWWHLFTKTSVPITNQSNLDWCGFDNALNLVTLDTKGMLRVLMRVSGWEWFPVLDLSLNLRPGHKFWPVCVKDSKFIYVLLNGENLPAIFPLPVTSIKPFRVPIIEVKISKDKQKNEAYIEYCHSAVWEYAKMASLYTEFIDASLNGFTPFNETIDSLEDRLAVQSMNMDKTLASLLQVACRSKNIHVALGIADRLSNLMVIQGCIQIADKFGCTDVAARLEEINLAKILQQEQEQEQQQEYMANNQEFDINNAQENTYDEVDNNKTFTLSRRTSSNKIENDENKVETKVIPRNPFLKNSPLQSPSKRKTVFDNMKELKTSPSPKKPMLARQTSFSTDARFKKNTNDKSII